MEEKKQDDNLNVTSDAETSNLNTETAPTPTGVTETSVATNSDLGVTEINEATLSQSGKSFNLKAYVGGVLAILAIFAVLIFALEKEGRISTGLFTGMISKMEVAKPVVKVNGVAITKGDYQSSYEQLSNMTAAQGADLTDVAVMESLKTQTIDTLVNAELLRQAAVEEGLEATTEDVDTRFNEIRENLGGAEVLAARMAEFGVTEAALRRDIENEFLIQQLFDLKIFDLIEVSDQEVQDLYDQAVAGGTELPPLEEIKETAIVEIRNGKAQPLINEYIQTLRVAANIEILI
ncbi:MAG TPA: SurA N-terminal domain-containing protein [Candidatus Paceibacterota bacterium]|nr:SurA N-terminal domain-containing protein [Candidatus Paceibacterota bacterium]HMO83129.1 SurA N-terminal domain-containing protein [Candidatus Paceibacterota bacterium]